uniref:Tetratricopeptide repeat protein n=1 Tax=Streptomyces sp. NBC_00093 TaxID=2975649 RepID=A0AAU2A1B7_9ACTN
MEVWDSGRPMTPFARKPTALLTAGLLDAERVVSVDRLIDAVWGERPPDTAAKLVQSYVSRLRQALHRPNRPEVIVTRPGGYHFRADEAELDVRRFQNLLTHGRTEARNGEHAAAADTLAAALDLWRGPALGGPETSTLQLEAARLEEMRMTAVEDLLGARLAAGAGAELVGELTRLVAGQPLRERLRALLMTALHRCGRRAEALRVYRDGHRVLRTELGIEPSSELRDLHARLLTGDEDTAPVLQDPQNSSTGPSVTHSGARGCIEFAATAAWARPATTHPHPKNHPPHPPPPAQLPAPPPWLTGRDKDADHLLSTLQNTSTAPRLCVIHGMPGIGKSALTLHVAHRLASAFPDGHLYAELCGTDPAQAAPPGRILGGFLHALGVRPTDLPASTAERAAAYRSLLAGRRVLVVLDDAAGDDQVRPLLPGAGPAAVLVNSRRSLPGLDATARIGLEVLGREHAVQLLGRLVGRDRLAAEPTAAAEIARLSGGLPLAVRIVGSRLRSGCRWPLRTFADRLRDEDQRLDELTCGDLDVRARIEAGYRALPERERRVFRRLGLLDSPDFAAWVAGPLLGVDPPSAQRLVERLAEARLLEPLGVDRTGQARYRFHDLVRLYARERAEREVAPEQRRAAVSRLLHAWLTLVCRAGAAEPSGTVHLKPRAADHTADPALVATLLDRPRDWLAAEHTSLVAAVDLAAGLGLDEQACDLATALVQATFRVNNRFDDWWRTHDTALKAARQAGNRRAEAVLLNGLGQLRYEQDRFADANHHYREALVRFRRLGDVTGQSTALSGIAVASREQGHFAEAMACLEQALPGFEQGGDDAGVAGAHYDLGAILREQGRSRESLAHLHRAVTVYRSLGSRRGEALALRGIGLVHRADGDLALAEERCSQALIILRSTGDRLMTAYAAQALAKVRFRRCPVGAQASALRELRESLLVCRELGDGFGEALVLRTLGELHLSGGALEPAAACLEQALDRWTRLSLPLFRARTLRDLARLHELRGDGPAALAMRREALRTFRRYGTREATELRALLGDPVPAGEREPE